MNAAGVQSQKLQGKSLQQSNGGFQLVKILTSFSIFSKVPECLSGVKLENAAVDHKEERGT